MRLLLDTHVWLWMQTDPDRLGGVAAAIADGDNEVFLSAASSWEISIKYDLGRLALPLPPGDYVPSRLVESGTTPLAIEHAQTLAAGALPPIHRDPFDRLLVAQSRALGVPLVSADPIFERYDVELIQAR